MLIIQLSSFSRSATQDATTRKTQTDLTNVGKSARGKNAIGKNVRGKIAIGKNVRAKVVKIP